MLAHTLAQIRQSHPTFTLPVRACVEAACLTEGPIGRAEPVARFLGLRNRFALARRLKSEGCPSLRRLTGWVTVLSWTVASDTQRVSLATLAHRAGRYPSTCYRLVKAVTGLPWNEVSVRGAEWVEDQLLREFAPPCDPTCTAHSHRGTGDFTKASR
jgi:hypothetical protein